jgi:hypothetical protein
MRGEERRVLASGGVHHRSDVVHPRLEGGDVAKSIREAHATLVEEDDARERRETLHEADEERLLPNGGQLGERSSNEDQVDRTGADDLVGDAHVTASGVARVGDDHGPILEETGGLTSRRRRLSAVAVVSSGRARTPRAAP